MELPSKELAKVQAAAYLTGRRPKGRAGNPPPLFPEDTLYVTAWDELDAERQAPLVSTSSVHRFPIPSLAIHKWAAIHFLEDSASLVRVIRAIDRIYLEWAKERDAMAQARSQILGADGRPLNG